jgi:ABC-type multidrug transport system ATPase subunit
VIELLGIGVQRPGDGWRVRRIHAEFQRGELAFVVSRAHDERLAVLDVIGGRVLPDEGRVWVRGIPLLRDTASRLREVVASVDVPAAVAGHRRLEDDSARARRLWSGPARLALEALSRVGLGGESEIPVSITDPPGRVRLAVARAVVDHPDYLAVRELDSGLEARDLRSLLHMLRALARRDRLAVIVSARRFEAVREFADRLLVIANGQVLFEGSPDSGSREAPVPSLDPSGTH